MDTHRGTGAQITMCSSCRSQMDQSRRSVQVMYSSTSSVRTCSRSCSTGLTNCNQVESCASQFLTSTRSLDSLRLTVIRRIKAASRFRGKATSWVGRATRSISITLCGTIRNCGRCLIRSASPKSCRGKTASRSTAAISRSHSTSQVASRTQLAS